MAPILLSSSVLDSLFATIAACEAEGPDSTEAAEAQQHAATAAQGCNHGAMAAEGVQPEYTHGVEPLQACRPRGY